ncbi:hypothetical protein PPERSA_08728 [Pseudocohnilembus persalinus]|uniref:EF-hand domain-containing protein n=1 Tax=Pseudocohnilembus persalinus TaxID=266149 RepID=A0A0V0QXS3_PSEPJ|nr:hypothetical protein PPERSA_08728 [Pseudocohnilembus persalinus]|eukprot:KRX07051.1 hypothetical protein PPERSA_08728 [Pseudocohnilembus persalinus]
MSYRQQPILTSQVGQQSVYRSQSPIRNSQISYKYRGVQGMIDAIRNAIQANRIDLASLFNRWTSNGDGTLTIQNLYELLNSFCVVSDLTTTNIFNQVDENRNGRMDYDEFRRLFDVTYGEYTVYNFISQLKDAHQDYTRRGQSIWKQFNFDGNGTLDISEFKVLALAVKPNLQDWQIRQFFNHFDSRGAGELTVVDFEKTILA